MLATMFAAFLIQIAFRYLANFPTGWTHELTVMLWIMHRANIKRLLSGAEGKIGSKA